MPRGTALSPEEKLAKDLADANAALTKVQERRENRRNKYLAADAKDVDLENKFRHETVRLQVTADHNAELQTRIAEELARLDEDGDDEQATVPADHPVHDDEL